jgi:limonene-1,2-epoxide hydrolase
VAGIDDDALMPWLPDFINAVELVRRTARAEAQADPVMQYIAALNAGDTHVLEAGWPGAVTVYDPHAGVVRGHRQLRQFVSNSQSWLAERRAHIETVAATQVGGRAVVEMLAHLAVDGQELSWPVAVVAESPDERSVVFRTYCSQWPLDGRRHIRPPILAPGIVHPVDVVGRYQTALAAGDTEAILNTFTPDGYYREPFGAPYTHRGPAELRAFFATCFSADGGISLEPCAVTDDGVRCVLEYNCVRWGSVDLPPQAGLAVHELGSDGLLSAVRVYDDVDAPVKRPTAI